MCAFRLLAKQLATSEATDYDYVGTLFPRTCYTLSYLQFLQKLGPPGKISKIVGTKYKTGFCRSGKNQSALLWPNRWKPPD